MVKGIIPKLAFWQIDSKYGVIFANNYYNSGVFVMNNKHFTGVFYILLFCILSAFLDVYVGNISQNIDPILLLFCNFLILTTFFAITHKRTEIPLIKETINSWKPILMLNIAAAASWIGLFYSLKYLEPAVVGIVSAAVGPVITIVLNPFFDSGNRITKIEKTIATCIVIVISVLLYFTYGGISGIGEVSSFNFIFGSICVIMCGIGMAATTLVTKKLMNERWHPSRILVSRSYIMLLISLFIILTKINQLQFSFSLIPAVLLIAFIGNIIPLYIYQLGVQRVEPFKISIMLLFLPIFTFILQLFDQRLEFSFPTLVCIIITIGFILLELIIKPKRTELKTVPSKNCAIVDAYSSGRYLAAEFKNLGYKVFHIQSVKNTPAFFKSSFIEEDFFDNIIIDNDLDKKIEQIKQLNPEFIFAGCESGVLTADMINNKLNLTMCNDYKLSKHRRNKFMMIDMLHRNGISAPKQLKSSDLNEIKEWINEHNAWPVVLKPLESAGSDNIWFCYDFNIVGKAFEKIINDVNKMGIKNESVLVQEFLDGTEYVVNTVSSNGEHVISEIVKYKKVKTEDNGILYDIDELQSSDSEIYSIMSQYINRVLNVLGVKYGPCHAEVMLTENKIPKLVEIGSRTDGILRPDVSSVTTGLGQIKLTALAYADTEEFKKYLTCPYLIKNNTINVALISHVEGTLQSLPHIEFIKSLPSFFLINLSVAVGEKIDKTKDVFSQPGTIYLVHESMDVIMQDYYKIRYYEKNGLYKVLSA